MLKKCHRCQADKPYDSFNKRKASKDGLQIRCRACQSEIEKDYYKGKGGPVRRLNHKKKYARDKDRQPEKIKARRLLNYAIGSGRIKRRPCEVCGERKAQAHHDDYSKPLEVRWLCKAHHDEHHRAERVAKRQSITLLDSASIKLSLSLLGTEVTQILRDISIREVKPACDVDWNRLTYGGSEFVINQESEFFRATILGVNSDSPDLISDVLERLNHMGWKEVRVVTQP